MDHVGMRQFNAAQTLELLYRHSPATMAALRAESHLSRRTLELILDDLMAQGWAVELPLVDSESRPVGRPARHFSFKYDAGAVLAIRLVAGQIHAAVANLRGEVLAEARQVLAVTTERRERLQRLDDCITQVLAAANLERSTVLAVTISTPGIVRDDGTVDLPMTMPGWTGFSLSEAVGELIGCPIRVENDAKLAALAEKWSGDRGVQDFVYVFTDSERIGLGLVLRDELYRGLNGAAGEIVWARHLGMHDLDSPLLIGLDDEDSPQHATAVALVAAARSGDPLAISEVMRLARSLVPGITAIAWLVAPEEIILGGSLGSIQDLLIPALQDLLAENDRPIDARIVGSQFGDRAILIGCLRMCMESLRAALFENLDLLELPAPAVAG
jgi:predicted NBD/HSP70 family sugar kinase